MDEIYAFSWAVRPSTEKVSSVLLRKISSVNLHGPCRGVSSAASLYYFSMSAMNQTRPCFPIFINFHNWSDVFVRFVRTPAFHAFSCVFMRVHAVSYVFLCFLNFANVHMFSCVFHVCFM